MFNSKEGYRQQILEWQKQLALETDEQQKQQLQGSIEKYQKAMAELPDGEGLVEAPVAFRTRPNGDEYMYLISDGSDGRYRSFTVTNDSAYNQYTLSYMASESGVPTMGNTFSTGIKCELERGIAEPVSYTHLDVYKRQVLTHRIFWWCFDENMYLCRA